MIFTDSHLYWSWTTFDAAVSPSQQVLQYQNHSLVARDCSQGGSEFIDWPFRVQRIGTKFTDSLLQSSKLAGCAHVEWQIGFQIFCLIGWRGNRVLFAQEEGLVAGSGAPGRHGRYWCSSPGLSVDLSSQSNDSRNSYQDPTAWKSKREDILTCRFCVGEVAKQATDRDWKRVWLLAVVNKLETNATRIDVAGYDYPRRIDAPGVQAKTSIRDITYNCFATEYCYSTLGTNYRSTVCKELWSGYLDCQIAFKHLLFIISCSQQIEMRDEQYLLHLEVVTTSLQTVLWKLLCFF